MSKKDQVILINDLCKEIDQQKELCDEKYKINDIIYGGIEKKLKKDSMAQQIRSIIIEAEELSKDNPAIYLLKRNQATLKFKEWTDKKLQEDFINKKNIDGWMVARVNLTQFFNENKIEDKKIKCQLIDQYIRDENKKNGKIFPLTRRE